MSGPTTDTPTQSPSKRSGRRRATIATAVVTVVVVLSVASALSVAENGKGASPVRSALIGHLAPKLTGETVTGSHASLAAYRGRWVIVNFFASWCVPCLKETPELVRFAAAHSGPADPAIIGVVYKDDDGSVRSFIHEHHVTWPLLAYRTINQAASYGVTGIPVTFLVSPDARVATKALGGLRAGQLDTLIADAQAKSATSTTETHAP